MNEHTRNKVLHSQAREVVAHVYNICDEESKNNQMKLPLKRTYDRAALYTGISKRSIERIHKEDLERKRTNPNQGLSSPSKKKPRLQIQDKIDEFDFSIIRRLIQKFYLELKIVPTTGKLLQKIKEEIDFPYSRSTLRRLLKENGFRFKKCRNKRKLLIEKPNILHWRYRYIRAIKKYRQEGRNIIYMDETWVDNDLTFKKCWQSDEIFGIVSNISSTGRLVIVHAGSEQDGFVPNASLIFKAGQASGDYHGQMNGENYMKWLNEKLLPNINKTHPNSVIVLDNAPYHSFQEDKTPTRSSLKKNMVDWLSNKGINHDPSSRKWELFELIQLHKPPSDVKNYVVDRIIKSHGHIPLRTPPYMCELNPIEMVWAQLKHYIRSHNTTGEFTIKVLKELTEEGIGSITKEDWKKYCNHVKKIEDEFWERDQYMEEVESLIISPGNNDSDSDSTDFSDNDAENGNSD